MHLSNKQETPTSLVFLSAPLASVSIKFCDKYYYFTINMSPMKRPTFLSYRTFVIG